MGRIFDISRSGISFCYVMDFPVPDYFYELGILVPNGGPFLNDLPFNTVYDEVVTDDTFAAMAVRRRGGSFNSLKPEQEIKLERFMEEHVCHHHV